MNNNFLKITTILCSLSLLPSIASATHACTPGPDGKNHCRAINNVITPQNIDITDKDGNVIYKKLKKTKHVVKDKIKKRKASDFASVKTIVVKEEEKKVVTRPGENGAGIKPKTTTEYTSTQEVGTNPDTYAPSKREDFSNKK